MIIRQFHDDGTFPNNSLPLLVYKNAVELKADDPAGVFESLFHGNGWSGSWRNGVYGYHHYHSTAHEVLGVYRGSSKITLGGPDGETFEVTPGDVVVIPAGVAHKNEGSSSDFSVVGAYPLGTSPDMNYGKAGERPAADEAIAAVPPPGSDPIYGNVGGLADAWQR